MLRISEMFVLLLVVLRGSLVVSTAANVSDVGPSLGQLGNVNAATSITDILDLFEGLKGIIFKSGDQLPVEYVTKILSFLTQGTALTVPTEFLQQLSSKLSDPTRVQDSLTQVIGSIANWVTIVKNWLESKTTGDEVVKLCESKNLTEVPKLLLFVYDQVKPAILNNQNPRPLFPTIVKENIPTNGCNESYRSLQQLTGFLSTYAGAVKNAVVISGLCSLVTGANQNPLAIISIKSTNDRLVAALKDLENLLKAQAEQQLNTIRNCVPPLQLSDELLALIAKIWPSIGQIGVGGVIGNIGSGIVGSGNIGSGVPTYGNGTNAGIHGSGGLNQTAG